MGNDKTPSIPNSLPTKAQSRQGLKKIKLVQGFKERKFVDVTVVSSSSDESTMSEADSSGDMWGPENEFGKFVGKENRNPKVKVLERKCRVNVKKWKPAESTITQPSEFMLCPSVSTVVSCNTISWNASSYVSSPTILSPTSLSTTSHVDVSKDRSSPRILPYPEVMSTPSVSPVPVCSTTTSFSRYESVNVSAAAILPTSPVGGISMDRSSPLVLPSPPVMSSPSSSTCMVDGTDRPSPPVLGRGVLALTTKTLISPPVCERTPFHSPNVYEMQTGTGGGASPPVMSPSALASLDLSPSYLPMVPPPDSMIPPLVSVQKEDMSILKEKSEECVNKNCQVSVMELRGKLELSEKKLEERGKHLEKSEKELEECEKKLEERKKKLEESEKKLERTQMKLKIEEKQVKNLNDTVQMLKVLATIE